MIKGIKSEISNDKFFNTIKSKSTYSYGGNTSGNPDTWHYVGTFNIDGRVYTHRYNYDFVKFVSDNKAIYQLDRTTSEVSSEWIGIEIIDSGTINLYITHPEMPDKDVFTCKAEKLKLGN